MGSRFVTAVALYGPKAAPVRDFLGRVQSVVGDHVGTAFRPYSLDQIHGTLILLTGVPDPRTGTIVNEACLARTGTGLEMDLGRAMRILAGHVADPIRVRIGGHGPGDAVPFRSRGQHLFDRSFSVQAGAFVLVGWPVAALAGQARPLDGLRRGMTAANVYHRYHAGETDIDDDLHLVVGHHAGAPPGALDRAVTAVREMLAADPVEFDIGAGEVKIVAAESHTLAPARYVSGIPVAEAVLRRLMS